MYERILVAVDGSTPSQRALDEAVKLVGLTQGKIHLVSVVPPMLDPSAAGAYAGFVPVDTQAVLEKDADDILQAALAPLQAKGVAADIKRLDLDVGAQTIAEAILAEATAWKADVVVLGTHGRRGVSRLLLGSVAEALLRISTLPLLLVKSPETT